MVFIIGPRRPGQRGRRPCAGAWPVLVTIKSIPAIARLGKSYSAQKYPGGQKDVGGRSRAPISRPWAPAGASGLWKAAARGETAGRRREQAACGRLRPGGGGSRVSAGAIGLWEAATRRGRQPGAGGSKRPVEGCDSAEEAAGRRREQAACGRLRPVGRQPGVGGSDWPIGETAARRPYLAHGARPGRSRHYCKNRPTLR